MINTSQKSPPKKEQFIRLLPSLSPPPLQHLCHSDDHDKLHYIIDIYQGTARTSRQETVFRFQFSQLPFLSLSSPSLPNSPLRSVVAFPALAEAKSNVAVTGAYSDRGTIRFY